MFFGFISNDRLNVVLIPQKDALVANVGAMGAIVANSAKLPVIPSPQGYVEDPS